MAELPRHRPRAHPRGAARHQPRRACEADRRGSRTVHDRLPRAHRAREGPASAVRGLSPSGVPRRRARGRPPVGGRLPRARSTASYLAGIERQMADWGLSAHFRYHGELDRGAKLAYLRELSVLSVPGAYADPKGLFLLEAMASGVPIVQPRRGAATEIVETTGGGILVAPGRSGRPGRGAARPAGETRRSGGRSATAGTTASALTTAPPGCAIGRSRSTSPCSRTARGASPCLKSPDLSKHYDTPAGAVAVLSGVDLRLEAGDSVVDRRSVRQRQEHAAAHPGRARAAQRGPRAPRRHGSVHAGRSPAGRLPQPAGRLRLPGSPSPAAVQRARERAHPDARRAWRRRGSAQRGRSSCSTRSA